MVHRTVTLLLSDIERHLSSDNAWPSMPAFQTLLSKGEQEALSIDSLQQLFQLFHFPYKTDADLPVGAISALGDELDASSGWWLRADPVHMIADRDQLYLSAAESLALSQEEADALTAELNELYEEDGWRFTAVAPQRWYLRLPHPLSMRTTPTAEAMGHRVGEILPQGEDALPWQRTMTEIQMQLHTSPVNSQRSETGSLAVNSLWFWGGGELPASECRTDMDFVITTDPLTLGLAKLCGVEVAPDSALRQISADKGDHVLWQTSMLSLEQAETNVFVPLLELLRGGGISELMIVLPGRALWRIERKVLRRWWRRRKPLAALLAGEA